MRPVTRPWYDEGGGCTVTRAALVALLLGPAVASAQGIVTPYRPPVIPPGSPAAVRPGFPPPVSPLPVVNYFPGLWPVWGYWQPPPTVVVVVPVVAPAPLPPTTTDDIALATAEVPATLTLELPAPADVWVNGRKLDGPAVATRQIDSPPLKLGSEHTFELKARWTADGVTYEVERTSTVAAGRTRKLAIFRGTPVK